MSTSIDDLKTKGFVSLDYPVAVRASVEAAISSWRAFCALPEDTKKRLPYSNNTAGVGYELKEGKGPKGDRKENFDIAIAGKDWVEKYINEIESDAALAFVHRAVSLVAVVKPLILGFAKMAEETFSLEGFRKEVEQSEAAFFIRFIHYFGDREPGQETASAHTDQSGFTLHLFESDPGLQCLSLDGKWMDMPVGGGETVIIPSMQMQLRSKGELKALCHRVIATEKTAKTGRYSAVCFVQLSKTPKYDKDRSGRLQEKAPGFNYHMEPEEFQKLFKG